MVATREQVDQFDYSGGSVTTVVVPTGPLADGNLLVLVCVNQGTRAIQSIDQTGATWVKAVDQLESGNSHRVEVWYAENIQDAAASIRVTLDVIPTLTTGFKIVEYSGAAASSVLDRTAAVDDGSPSWVDFKDPTLTDEGDELWIWALGTASAGLTADRQHLNYADLGTLQDFGAFSLHAFESLSNIKGEPQGACRTTGATQPVSNALATFKAAAPLDLEVARVQTLELSGGDGVGPFVDTLPKTPTAGNLLVAIIATYEGVTVSSITQTRVTWVQAASRSTGSGSSGVNLEIWFGTILPSASTSVSVAISASSQIAIELVEYSGLAADTIDVIESSLRAVGVGTAIDTGADATPPDSGRLILTGIGCADGNGSELGLHTPTGGFALFDKGEGGGVVATQHSVAGCDLGMGAPAAPQCQITQSVSSAWATIMLTLIAEQAAPTPPEAPTATEIIAETADVSARAIGRLAEEYKG